MSSLTRRRHVWTAKIANVDDLDAVSYELEACMDR